MSVVGEIEILTVFGITCFIAAKVRNCFFIRYLNTVDKLFKEYLIFFMGLYFLNVK